MASTTAYSPKLFIESYQAIAQCVRDTAHNVDNFQHSMSTAADQLNTAIADINLQQDSQADSMATKREFRSCRENYLKTLACSTTFVDRFNKLLHYADLDDTWKGNMVEAASNGDYKSFSSYISQIKRYLDQLNQTYQHLVQAFADAEAQCRGIPEIVIPPPIPPIPLLDILTNPAVSIGTGIAAFIISRLVLASSTPASIAIGEGVFIGAEALATPFPPPIFRIHPALSLGAGIIAFGLSYLLVGLQLPGSIAVGMCAFIVIGAASYILSIMAMNKENKNPSPRIQYKKYNSMRSAASAINSSGLKLQKVLSSLGEDQPALRQAKGRVNAALFVSALDSLLEEIKEAHRIVNPCFEKLDTHIKVQKVKNN